MSRWTRSEGWRRLRGMRARVAAFAGILVLGVSVLSGQEATSPNVQGQPIADPADVYRPGLMPDRIVLSLTSDPAHSMAVTWRTADTVKNGFGEIAVAEGGPYFSTKARRVPATTQLLSSDLSQAHYHTVHFEDLEPSTQYAYRVGDGWNWSEWSHFVTASAEPAPFSFIYFGDAQNDIKLHWSRVIREAFATAPRARFMLHAGDLINRSSRDAEWGEWHYAGGWLNATIPTLATPGNHEYGRNVHGRPGLDDHWRPQFCFPENGPAGRDELKETTYYVDYQGARIISLNSNVFLPEQAAWLDQLLTKEPTRWKIVFMHHPVYSSKAGRDNAALRAALQPVFDKHRVDLVLQGHDHTYARSGLLTASYNEADGTAALSDEGTLYVVSVSGPKMYDLGWRPFMRRVAEGSQLFQIITVDQDELRYEARLATGELYDAFRLRKTPSGKNELLDEIPDTKPRRFLSRQ